MDRIPGLPKTPEQPIVPPDDPHRGDVDREPSIDPPSTEPPMRAPSEKPVISEPPARAPRPPSTPLAHHPVLSLQSVFRWLLPAAGDAAGRCVSSAGSSLFSFGGGMVSPAAALSLSPSSVAFFTAASSTGRGGEHRQVFEHRNSSGSSGATGDGANALLHLMH